MSGQQQRVFDRNPIFLDLPLGPTQTDDTDKLQVDVRRVADRFSVELKITLCNH